MQIHTYAESYMTAFLWDCWQEDPSAGSAQPSQQMGPAEPMNRLFFPGPGFNQKEKYYSNWQVTCIVSFLKKLLQNNETTLSPLLKKRISLTQEGSTAHCGASTPNAEPCPSGCACGIALFTKNNFLSIMW